MMKPRFHFIHNIFALYLTACSLCYELENPFFAHRGLVSSILFKFWIECQMFVTTTQMTFLTFASHMFTHDMNENIFWPLIHETSKPNIRSSLMSHISLHACPFKTSLRNKPFVFL